MNGDCIKRGKRLGFKVEKNGETMGMNKKKTELPAWEQRGLGGRMINYWWRRGLLELLISYGQSFCSICVQWANTMWSNGIGIGFIGEESAATCDYVMWIHEWRVGAVERNGNDARSSFDGGMRWGWVHEGSVTLDGVEDNILFFQFRLIMD